jgi:hypothetical protein
MGGISVMSEMLVIQPDGSAELRDVPTTYPEFNQAVLDGGYMQEMRCIAPDGSQVVFLMDEEGKYKNLAPNHVATAVWYGMGGAQLLPGDVFSGTVAICGAKGEGLTDIPEFAGSALKAAAAGVKAATDGDRRFVNPPHDQPIESHQEE